MIKTPKNNNLKIDDYIIKVTESTTQATPRMTPRKSEDWKPENVKEHITTVEDTIEEVKQDQGFYKITLKELRQRSKKQLDMIERGFNDLSTFLTPSIMGTVKELELGMGNNKDDTYGLQSQVTELRKENKQLKELIEVLESKVQVLEKSVGKYDKRNLLK